MADEDISSSDEYSGPKINHSELLDKWKSDALPKRKKRNKVIHAMNKLGMSTSYDTFLRNKKLIKKLQDGGVIEASSTTESIVNDMFGEERVDFQNIPTPSTQREITGDTTEDIISEVLKQLDLGWQLPVKNAEELNDVLAQKLEGRMRAQFEHLCEFWDLLLKNFTFDDLNVETYKKLSSFACSKKNNPLFDDSDELGGVNSAIFDVARIERFLFKYPAGSSKVSNSAWRNLYHSLVDACVRSVRRSYSINQPADGEDKLSSDLDRTMLSPFICHKGECKFDVKMIIEGDAKPSPETEMSPPGSPGTSETSTGIEKERSITVRAVPDLTIYSMWEFWKLIQTIPILVIEVKTSKRAQLNQVEYVAKTSDGRSKENMTGGSDSDASLEHVKCGSGDADQVNFSRKSSNSTSDVKSHESVKKRKIGGSSSSSLSRQDDAESKRLDSVHTQHFFELLGPLKDSEFKTVENAIPKKPTKIFGCYIMKNKIHLTALRVGLARSVNPTNFAQVESATEYIRFFIDKNTTKDYAETHKRVQFKYTCTDYLDLFNLKHFTVFIKWLYYILLK